MKPEAKASWADSLWRWALGWLGAALIMCSAAHAEPTAATQLKQAAFLIQPGQQFAQPPSKMPPNDLPETDWRKVDLPHVVPRNEQAQTSKLPQTKTAWYRLDLAQAQACKLCYLYIPRWKTDADGQIAVYADGQLLYQSEGSLYQNGFNKPMLLRLNPGADIPLPKTVLLRIEQFESGTSALSTVWVGPASQLVWRYQVRHFLQNQLPLMGGATFLFVGFFALAVWFTRRRETIYLLFFFASLAAFVRMLQYHVGGHYLIISDEWFQWVTVMSMLWLLYLVRRFLEYLHKRTLRWLTPAILTVTVLINLATLPSLFSMLPSLTHVAPVLYLVLFPLVLLMFAEALRSAITSRSHEVSLTAGWFLFASVLTTYDLLLEYNKVSPEGIYTNAYGIMGLFFLLVYIMYRRYVGAISEVETVNTSLAERLQKREAELAISYERLREVERRQAISNERQRLTQDMHDGLGSSLVSALRVVESGRMTDAELGDVLKGCIDDLKLTLDSMESVEADLLLLLATLRFRLGPRLNAAGIALKWEVTDVPKLEWLDPRNALHILRIFQEAFANILKHTRATEIRVCTALHGQNVLVSIYDDGCGFDVDYALGESAGRGLNNQQRRAQAIDGAVSWASGPLGTCFMLRLPLHRVSDSAGLKIS
jgi:signal transduction histidine kinase